MKKWIIGVAGMVALVLAPLQLASVGGTQYCSTRCAGSRCWTECTTSTPIKASDVWAAELTQQDKGFNWQDREYFGRAYTERQMGGGDSATAGDSGDAGAAAGATGGDSGGNGEGDGCGPR